jgi:5-methylcytosine-specific restriction endonuclease McrA
MILSVMNNMKKCCRCHQLKPLSLFHNHRKRKDGKQGFCIPCGKDQIKRYRQTHKQELKAYYQNIHSNRGLANRIVLFRRRHPTVDPLLTLDNVKQKFGVSPKCYLSGQTIDLEDRDSYALDHILPISKGGDSSLANCGLTTQKVNKLKSDLTKEEFITTCSNVVRFQESLES